MRAAINYALTKPLTDREEAANGRAGIGGGIDAGQGWFTAAELAELELPGVPADKRSINRRAQDEGWAARKDGIGGALVRPRKGRGGGAEYHFSLLPGPAQMELARRGMVREEAPQAQDAEGGRACEWDWYARQNATTRREAKRRLAIVDEVELMVAAGATKSAAIQDVAEQRGVGKSTLWSWMREVDGNPPCDRLPLLAPRRTGGGRKAAIDSELWREFKSDYLRASEPTLTSCYRRACQRAAQRGLSLPSEKAFRRRLEAEIDPRILTMRRKGPEALRRGMPAQRRSVEQLRVLEVLNIDGHKFDVFVTPPPREGRSSSKPIRPVMVALQDVRSSKIVAWRVGESESAALARLAFADCFRDFGIPRACLLDNGRGFASKWLTGGAKTRFRFKIKPEEPEGLLTALGIEIHWAKPYRGQSKPIERAFRDLADSIARAPEAEGAYTGNSPGNKPHNHGARAMEWDAFQRHVAQGIAEHNARMGRTGRDYRGRSFDDVFEAGYAVSPVTKATPAQMRMALLAAEQKSVNRATGEISLFGNRYYHHDCERLKGQKVTVRFDPENLHGEVHLYDQQGAFLLTVPVFDDNGFLDSEAARATGKREAELNRRVREGIEAERLLDAAELAARQPRARMPELPPAGVVRLLRTGTGTSVAEALPEGEPEPGQSPLDRMRRGILRVVDND